VLVHSSLVQGVDHGGLGLPAGGADLLGHPLQRRQRAAGQVDPGAFARERAGDRAADGSTAAVDDRVPAVGRRGLADRSRDYGVGRRHPAAEL
jgi:hypothetical protein